MIKALALIFDPTNTWDKIENAHHKVSTVFLQFFLPLLLLTSVAEMALLMKLGAENSSVSERIMEVPLELALRYALTHLALTLGIVFGGAALFAKIGAGFHRPHSYTQCFTTLAYAISPLLLLRVLDGVPAINTWLCWGIGMFLSLSVLYRGVPRVMRPDPSGALGLYLLFSLVLLVLAGLAHFVAVLVLEEKFLA